MMMTSDNGMSGRRAEAMDATSSSFPPADSPLGRYVSTPSGNPMITSGESAGRHRSRHARDTRLVDVFLHASAMLSAAEAAAAIGVRPTTVHRWRSTGGDGLSADVRDGILAFLARWSMRSECRDDATPLPYLTD